MRGKIALPPRRYGRPMWALGDYHRFAIATVWQLGPELVEACGIGPGRRVLDVAAGTGNVAIRAAEAGADVVACDLEPGNFGAGRAEARARGVELEWVQADAQALPFGDGEFDVVTSSFGAIFAPDHEAVAREMRRVCRPGGTIGMINFRPVGAAAEFFALLAGYAPPGGDGPPPLLWGEEAHVRALLGEAAQTTHRRYVERVDGGPAGYRELFRETFGPYVAIRASLDAERAAALDRDFLEFATRWNEGAPGGAAEIPYDYLLVVVRR
jgi:ubiquinone/menaquinone biosynthesis C-methylase UbiE